METFGRQTFTGERPLYGIRDAQIDSCVFGEGESPLKECRDITVRASTFGWKYPLWYCRNVVVQDTTWEEMARAGVWYSHDVTVSNSTIYAPKNFRRCSGLQLTNVRFTNAAETLWNCTDVVLNNIEADGGDYLAMNSHGVEVTGLKLNGNYAFDGCSDVTIRDSRLNTKDAFWNCRNVLVENSYINGEYLGWNSSDLTFVNCTIESNQGLCYIDNLKLVNCRLVNTTLAFEYSSVDAVIDSDIDSVFNPKSGTITCGRIGELIIERDKVDPSKTIIKAAAISRESDRPGWLS